MGVDEQAAQLAARDANALQKAAAAERAKLDSRDRDLSVRFEQGCRRLAQLLESHPSPDVQPLRVAEPRKKKRFGRRAQTSSDVRAGCLVLSDGGYDIEFPKYWYYYVLTDGRLVQTSDTYVGGSGNPPRADLLDEPVVFERLVLGIENQVSRHASN